MEISVCTEIIKIIFHRKYEHQEDDKSHIREKQELRRKEAFAGLSERILEHCNW